MSFKLCQKWSFAKELNIVYFGPKTYQIMYGETLDFQRQHQQW